MINQSKMKPSVETETIEYYNKNTVAFINDTRNIEFQSISQRFHRYLCPKSRILDFGCGSGRDTKYFLQQGFAVDAVDGSKEICISASSFTGIEVKQMLFRELDVWDFYDGVWANASILHLPYDELKVVLAKIANALKENGILYASFKYGEYEGVRNGRYFIDMTEEKVHIIMKEIDSFDIKEIWVTSDVRPERDDEKWLNLILIKNCQNQK